MGGVDPPYWRMVRRRFRSSSERREGASSGVFTCFGRSQFPSHPHGGRLSPNMAPCAIFVGKVVMEKIRSCALITIVFKNWFSNKKAKRICTVFYIITFQYYCVGAKYVQSYNT
jgi:hypothetical protein